jgi:hypothetical protein
MLAEMTDRTSPISIIRNLTDNESIQEKKAIIRFKLYKFPYFSVLFKKNVYLRLNKNLE